MAPRSSRDDLIFFAPESFKHVDKRRRRREENDSWSMLHSVSNNLLMAANQTKLSQNLSNQIIIIYLLNLIKYN